jgi:hypothetical protein
VEGCVGCVVALEANEEARLKNGAAEAKADGEDEESSSARARAISAPTRALFSTSAMLAEREAPAVSSLTRLRMKGVTAAPFISGSDLASSNAC